MVTNNQTKSTQIIANVDKPLDQALKKKLIALCNKRVTTIFEGEQL
jgi:hypothetical protein